MKNKSSNSFIDYGGITVGFLSYKDLEFLSYTSVNIKNLRVMKSNFFSVSDGFELLFKSDDYGDKVPLTLNDNGNVFYTQHEDHFGHIWKYGHLIDSRPVEVDTKDLGMKNDEISLQYKRLIAGGLAGALSRTITAPIDRVKVLLQVHGYKHVKSGIAQSLKYMISEGGFMSLWRGNGISVMKIVPESALKYTLYEYYKLVIRGNSEKADQSLQAKFLAGSLAGVSSQTVIYPLETLKTRMCLRKTGQYNSIFNCAKTIYLEGGLAAFYRGFFINLAGMVPYAGIELTLYEKCKSVYMSWNDLADNQHPPPHVIPLISSFSTTCGLLTIYPFALIRTKLQSKTEFSEKAVNNPLVLLGTIWREAGISGLYRGLTANLCKVLPASSISYLTFEHLNSKFHLKSFGSE